MGEVDWLFSLGDNGVEFVETTVKLFKSCYGAQMKALNDMPPTFLPPPSRSSDRRRAPTVLRNTYKMRQWNTYRDVFGKWDEYWTKFQLPFNMANLGRYNALEKENCEKAASYRQGRMAKGRQKNDEASAAKMELIKKKQEEREAREIEEAATTRALLEKPSARRASTGSASITRQNTAIEKTVREKPIARDPFESCPVLAKAKWGARGN